MSEEEVDNINNKRIAKNTLLLYGRMLIGMLISLYTSRVILSSLGVVDYGLNNVVGGLVSMFSIISGSLVGTISRFITFEIGKGDEFKLEKLFSTSIWVMIFLSVIVFILMETVGLWFLNEKMVIPESRVFAANMVFQGSIFSFIFSLFTVSYNAVIVAHERMSAFAYLGILQIFVNLLIVLFVAYSPFVFDKLIVFSILQVSLSVAMQFFYYRYCKSQFSESHFNWSFDRTCFKEMGVFAIWNFIGSTAGTLKDQGINVLLNLFYGPILNAARGVANSVNTAVSSFVSNFMMAMNPQITKAYATRDLRYMHSLMERGSRLSYFILLILVLPFLFETEFILTLWLKNYPVHTANFVRLILIITMSDSLSNTLITAQNANGNIRNYQCVVGITLLMNFPLSYIFLKLNFPPESTMIVALVLSFCCMILRLLFLRKSVNFSMFHFLRYVYLKVLVVTLLSIIIPCVISFNLGDGWFRFFFLSIMCVVFSSIFSYTVGCSSHEKKFVTNLFRKYLKKVFA
jgi:O-antigen/teichoic acid export membrane protein